MSSCSARRVHIYVHMYVHTYVAIPDRSVDAGSSLDIVSGITFDFVVSTYTYTNVHMKGNTYIHAYAYSTYTSNGCIKVNVLMT